jgi:hypothetical protein
MALSMVSGRQSQERDRQRLLSKFATSNLRQKEGGA